MDDTFNAHDLERQLFNLQEFYRTDKFTLDIRYAYPGMVLKEAIYDDGKLLLKAGSILSESNISGIKRRGIQEIVIDPKDDVLASLDGIVNATVDAPTLNQMKKMLRNTESLNDATIRTLINGVKIIAERVLAADHFTYSMSDYLNDIEQDLASHSVRTCVYALVLAKAYNKTIGAPKLSYDDIAIAAMFHDIGSSCKSSDVRSKVHFLRGFEKVNPYLTDENIKLAIKNYNPQYDTYYAYCILNEYNYISAVAKSAIFFSRENQKGTGPYHDKKMDLGKGDIRLLSASMVGAEIINICSAFDQEICNCLEKNKTLENVQVFIQSLFMTKTFNSDLLNLLVENIPLYPIGTRVKLGDEYNSSGIVVKNFNEFNAYHRPQILKFPERKIMDLRYSMTPIINEVCKNESRISETYINHEPLDDEAPKR